MSARNYGVMTTTCPMTVDGTGASVCRVAAILVRATSLVDADDVMADDLAACFELAGLYAAALALTGGGPIPSEDDSGVAQWGSVGDCLDAAVAETTTWDLGVLDEPEAAEFVIRLGDLARTR